MVKFFLSLLSITSVTGLYASSSDWVVYDWDLELMLSRMPSRLMAADKEFTKEEIQPIFDKLTAMKPKEARRSDASEESIESDRSASTASSRQYVDAMEEALLLCFEPATSKPEQERKRHTLIDTLHSMEEDVDPVIFQKGIELIANRLGG